MVRSMQNQHLENSVQMHLSVLRKHHHWQCQHELPLLVLLHSLYLMLGEMKMPLVGLLLQVWCVSMCAANWQEWCQGGHNKCSTWSRRSPAVAAEEDYCLWSSPLDIPFLLSFLRFLVVFMAAKRFIGRCEWVNIFMHVCPFTEQQDTSKIQGSFRSQSLSKGIYRQVWAFLWEKVCFTHNGLNVRWRSKCGYSNKCNSLSDCWEPPEQ